MQTILAGNDIGILVLARAQLLAYPKTNLAIQIQPQTPNTESKISVSALKTLATQYDLPDLGIIHDRKNPVKTEFKTFSDPILKTLALEGLTDSIEFRRLARRTIRQAKSHNLKAIFFPESLFGEARTKRILQHLAGSQLKVITLDAFFTPIPTQSSQQKIDIQHQEDPNWLQKRAEQILQTKLKV